MKQGINLAYWAGVFDGDGSFSLVKATSSAARSPLYYPLIQFCNTNKTIVAQAAASFDGTITERLAYTAKDGCKRKASYNCKIEKANKCLPVLDKLIPYLIVKKERAEYLRNYIIDNPFIRGSNALRADVLIAREKAYVHMRNLNDTPEINGKLFSKKRRNNNANAVFWSYVAGLMDTDGSFSLKKEIRTSGGSKSPVYTPVVQISMVDCRAIYYLLNNFAHANLVIAKAKTTTTGICYRFSITSRKNAIVFLKNCLPYLQVKKEVAGLLLNYCENVVVLQGNKKLTAEEIEKRNTICNAIKSLNMGSINLS